LSKLARALEVPITAFFRLEPDRKSIVFCQADGMIRIPQPCGSWESLGGESFTGRMEPYRIALEEGGNSGPYPISHSGSEFVIVLAGQLSCEVAGEQFNLKKGDSLLFDASQGHGWQNPGPGAAHALILAAEFDTDERPGEYHVAASDRSAGQG
jgi:mannose-6-phosphate isomerase-like protein (cupin superfamily)